MSKYQNLTDEEIVVAYQKGDFDAIEYICRKYGGLVSRYGNQFYIKGSDKQDVVQEGMVGLFKAIQDYDVNMQVPFSTFADLCIRRQIMKAIASADTKKNQPLNSYVSISSKEEAENIDGDGNYLVGHEADPEQLILDSEQTILMTEKIMLSLSKMELEVFLYMMQGLDYKLIAEKMGKTEKNIDNAIQRIRQKVKKILL